MTGTRTAWSFTPRSRRERCPDFRFVLRGAFPVSQWLAEPCRVVPGHSSGGCARFSLASLHPSELSSRSSCFVASVRWGTPRASRTLLRRDDIGLHRSEHAEERFEFGFLDVIAGVPGLHVLAGLREAAARCVADPLVEFLLEPRDV